MLLLELEAPFDPRAVQLARRKMAKRWHPDIAPPGPPARAPAPPPGHQRSGGPAAGAGRELPRWPRQPQRGQGLRRRHPACARGGRPPGLRGGAAQAGRSARTRHPRSVRLARPRPLGRAPLRAVPVLSGVGCGNRERHLFLRGRGRRAAVGEAVVLGRDSHRAGGLAAVRRLLQARPGSRPGPALHDRGPARAGRGKCRAGGAASDLRARRGAGQPGGAADCSPWPSGRPGTYPRPPARCATGRGSRAIGRPRSGSPPASTRTWARSTWPPRRPNAPPSAALPTPRPGSDWGACGCG